MMFTCQRAQKIWRGLGLGDIVRAASAMDRSGSVILEELLCSSRPGRVVCNVQNITATVMVTCWYIWWSRRQIKNKEPVRGR